MMLGNRNFGLPGARGQRIVRRFSRIINGKTVRAEVRSKTQNTVRVGWNYTVRSGDTVIEGFTNVLTAEEASECAFAKWATTVGPK